MHNDIYKICKVLDSYFSSERYGDAVNELLDDISKGLPADIKIILNPGRDFSSVDISIPNSYFPESEQTIGNPQDFPLMEKRVDYDENPDEVVLNILIEIKNTGLKNVLRDIFLEVVSNEIASVIINNIYGE